jgi:hypothetical protein
MNGIIKIGDFEYNSNNDTWVMNLFVKTTDAQYDADGYVFDVVQPVYDSTTLAAWVAQVKEQARTLVSGTGGPTMADSDFTIIGGPTV